MENLPLERKKTGFTEGVRHQLALALEMKKKKKQIIVSSYKDKDWAKEALFVKAIFKRKIEKEDQE